MQEYSTMMDKYNEIKNSYRDYILFFKLSDFYEMFYAEED